jgi:hypothetical protein
MIHSEGTPLTDWQAATIRAFVTPQKRDRHIEAISNEKHRLKFRAALSHFSDFDSRWIVPIAPSSQNATSIHAMLKAHGASETCQAISELKELDAREVRLEDALKRIVGSQMGTILCCLPGRLAYFENEDTRFILERTK